MLYETGTRKEKIMRVYLDNCCFNRPYDDQMQLKIELETKAKLFIQALFLQWEDITHDE